FAPETDFSGYDVIVDCILGTGFSGEVRGNARTAIDAINRSGAYVISVDINSGMNGDTGEAVTAVHSDLTVSIGFIKNGLVTESAKKYIKELTNVDIGIVLVDE
ncbi:MAG: NAD(P)H-hydrate epimerase, partial [Oscillospiraceae bacterium]|nr:NAD(P)H-hydrate epimerase [Oscillospiraceae bacterium]